MNPSIMSEANLFIAPKSGNKEVAENKLLLVNKLYQLSTYLPKNNLTLLGHMERAWKWQDVELAVCQG